MKEIIFEIKKRFEKALERKTGWGKNEVKALHDEIVIEVLAENVGKSPHPPPDFFLDT